MKRHSIRFKLMMLMGIGFFLSSIFIMLILDREMRAITDVNQKIIYNEKIDDIRNVLDLNYKRLQETLMVEAYQADFQESVIADLRDAYYHHSSLPVFPIIFDPESRTVMHPIKAAGSRLPEMAAVLQALSGTGEGDIVRTNENGREEWVIVRRFEPWQWNVAYIVPMDVKYASVNRFRRIMILIVSGIALGILVIVYLVLRRMTQPIVELAALTIEMAEGSLTGDIRVRTRDEVGVLARNFKHMRNVVAEKIAELERENARRRAAQAATLESETKYRLLFENANDAIFIVQDMAVQFPNPRTLDLFGYSAAELDGMPIAQLVHPEDRERVMDIHRRRVAGDPDVPTNYTARFVDKWGDEHRIDISAVAITWEGRPASLSFQRDITQQWELEAQLRHAQKMEAVGVLAGGIAHDFNNILSGVLGYTEVAMDRIRKKDFDVLSDLNCVYQAGTRAKEVVRQILQFSRQAEAAFYPLDVADIVDEVIQLLMVSLPATIEIRQDHAPERAQVLADSGQIHQVVMNLCTNAAHAMGEKGGSLTVSTRPETLQKPLPCQGAQLPAGPYMVISVHDTGPGLDEKILERIFEPYFTTKPKDQGTGLGLAVSDGIVRSHGGAMTVSSIPEKETVFRVYLPVHHIQDESLLDVDAELTGGHEHILFVDDEAFFKDLSERILSDLGYRVTALDDSLHALEMLSAPDADVDLLVTDQTMPGLTGVNLVRAIRENGLHIPVILCTGFSEHIQDKTAAAIGVSQILYKPVTKRELAVAIRSALDEHTEKGA